MIYLRYDNDVACVDVMDCEWRPWPSQLWQHDRGCRRVLTPWKSNEGSKKRKGTKVTMILTTERRKKCSGKPSLMLLVIEFGSYVPNLNKLDSNVRYETVDYE